MHALILSFFALLPGAPAQGYGYGAYGALNCDLPYQAAPGAVDPRDVLLNNQGLIRQSQAQMNQINRQMAQLNQGLAQDRFRLQQFLGAPAILAMDQHQRFGGGPAGYRPACGAPPAVAGPVLPAGNLNLQPTPAAFCVNAGGHPQNLWTTQFAGPNGRVNESICNYQPGYRMPQPPPRAMLCRRQLQAYYQRLGMQAEMQRRIGILAANLGAYQLEDQRLRLTAEGGFCIECQRNAGALTGGPTNANGMAPLMKILMSVLGGNRGQQRPGGGGFGGGQGPYPSIPYQARMRGYYNPRGAGGYGTVPGGIGRGAFAGCGGPAALGLGAQFAPPVMPIGGDGAASPFAPSYANDLINPSTQNALFNPGFGAGFGPSVAGSQPPPDVLPLLNQNGAGYGQLAGQPGYGFGQTPAFQPNIFGSGGQFGIGSQPNVAFAQMPRYPQYPQYQPAPLGPQFGPGGGFRPAPFLPAMQPIAPAFGVGQGLGPQQYYQNLAYLNGRAQYGLGMAQGPNYGLMPAPPLPPPPPVLPMQPVGYVPNAGAAPLPIVPQPARTTGPPASLPSR